MFFTVVWICRWDELVTHAARERMGGGHTWITRATAPVLLINPHGATGKSEGSRLSPTDTAAESTGGWAYGGRV